MRALLVLPTLLTLAFAGCVTTGGELKTDPCLAPPPKVPASVPVDGPVFVARNTTHLFRMDGAGLGTVDLFVCQAVHMSLKLAHQTPSVETPSGDGFRFAYLFPSREGPFSNRTKVVTEEDLLPPGDQGFIVFAIPAYNPAVPGYGRDGEVWTLMVFHNDLSVTFRISTDTYHTGGGKLPLYEHHAATVAVPEPWGLHRAKDPSPGLGDALVREETRRIARDVPYQGAAFAAIGHYPTPGRCVVGRHIDITEFSVRTPNATNKKTAENHRDPTAAPCSEAKYAKSILLPIEGRGTVEVVRTTRSEGVGLANPTYVTALVLMPLLPAPPRAPPNP